MIVLTGSWERSPTAAGVCTYMRSCRCHVGQAVLLESPATPSSHPLAHLESMCALCWLLRWMPKMTTSNGKRHLFFDWFCQPSIRPSILLSIIWHPSIHSPETHYIPGTWWSSMGTQKYNSVFTFKEHISMFPSSTAVCYVTLTGTVWAKSFTHPCIFPFIHLSNSL